MIHAFSCSSLEVSTAIIAHFTEKMCNILEKKDKYAFSPSPPSPMRETLVNTIGLRVKDVSKYPSPYPSPSFTLTYIFACQEKVILHLLHPILHPILHPRPPVFTSIFGKGEGNEGKIELFQDARARVRKTSTLLNSPQQALPPTTAGSRQR